MKGWIIGYTAKRGSSIYELETERTSRGVCII